MVRPDRTIARSMPRCTVQMPSSEWWHRVLPAVVDALRLKGPDRRVFRTASCRATGIEASGKGGEPERPRRPPAGGGRTRVCAATSTRRRNVPRIGDALDTRPEGAYRRMSLPTGCSSCVRSFNPKRPARLPKLHLPCHPQVHPPEPDQAVHRRPCRPRRTQPPAPDPRH